MIREIGELVDMIGCLPALDRELCFFNDTVNLTRSTFRKIRKPVTILGSFRRFGQVELLA
ncbi:hypothetical protein ASD00_32625 [Ensifer sp. Root31]|nr:hypothetical protein ASD00_32625 [Ensifer sp. Root31]